MWQEQTISLGKVKEKTTTEFSFKWTGEPLDITRDTENRLRIKASCGCTKVTWDEKTQTLNGTFKSGAIPYHLIRNGERAMTSTKTISITYKLGDGEKTDNLTITATVVK